VLPPASPATTARGGVALFLGSVSVTLFNEILNQKSEVVCTVEVIALLATRAEG
jgi:hypothetical protein